MNFNRLVQLVEAKKPKDVNLVLISDLVDKAHETGVRLSPEDEARITDSESAWQYAAEVAKCRVPAIEKTLLHNSRSGPIAYYALDVIKGRWPEAETILATDHLSDGYSVCIYADAIHRRFIPGEYLTIRDTGDTDLYIKGLKTLNLA